MHPCCASPASSSLFCHRRTSDVPPDQVVHLSSALGSYAAFLTATTWIGAPSSHHFEHSSSLLTGNPTPTSPRRLPPTPLSPFGRCAATVAVAAVLIRYRKTKLLKASQLPMLALIMAAMVYGCLRVSLSIPSMPTQQLCVVRYWFGHLAFTSVSAFMAKTLRVHLVVNAGMRKVKIKTNAVFAFAVALMAVTVVLMVIMTPVNKEAVYNDDDYNIQGVTTHKYYCASKNWKVDFVLYAYEMMQVVVCLKVRPPRVALTCGRHCAH